MKKVNIYYWICTGFLIPGLGIGSIYGILLRTGSTEQFVRLGYPVYLAPFLGVARILGLIAIISNHKYPRLKEWAYAGLAFDIIGAIYSQIATSQSIADLFFPVLAMLMVSGSYFFYHKRLRLRSEVIDVKIEQRSA